MWRAALPRQAGIFPLECLRPSTHIKDCRDAFTLAAAVVAGSADGTVAVKISGEAEDSFLFHKFAKMGKKLNILRNSESIRRSSSSGIRRWELFYVPALCR